MQSPATSANCLVVLTDLLYLPGTRRLITSWRLHQPPLPIIVLSAQEEALRDPFLCAHCHRRIPINPAPYADIRPYQKRRSRRHAQTFFKFEAFGDFGFERNLFLDSDILCLRETPALLAPGTVPLRAARDTGFRKTRAYKGHAIEINSGVLSIGRAIQGAATIARLQDIARTQPGRGGYNAGDQGIVNKWIHRDGIDVELLPPEYNLIKKDYADTTGLADCRLLHFAGHKPWLGQRHHGDSGPPVRALEQLWHEGRRGTGLPIGET
ncbi:hypothetical protein [Synoicihabitans lomoniglobus]|uniref:Glycosyl transferase family 8 n=1 Tax=Synoicihabitans lomoniglobus TaxID=2909285 RepID=A0AAF0I3K4_9BACT|nr:hypothetical protein [Opitutaceae bacterium LMO-M01]WED65970.1 hypothetical protein PXH66_03790 [Opitutaceae bacterium LMO-M01]